MNPFLTDPLHPVIYPQSGTARTGILCLAGYPVSRQLTKLIATRPLLILDHQSTPSTRAHPYPPPGPLYILLPVARAPGAMVFAIITSTPQIRAWMHPLA